MRQGDDLTKGGFIATKPRWVAGVIGGVALGGAAGCAVGAAIDRASSFIGRKHAAR